MVAGNHLIMDLAVQLIPGIEPMEGSILDDLQYATLLASSLVQHGTLPQILDQWIGRTSSRFMLNVVKSHHIQLRCHCPLFCYFEQINVKASVAHHHVIQQEVDELLAKVTIELSTCSADF